MRSGLPAQRRQRRRAPRGSGGFAPLRLGAVALDLSAQAGCPTACVPAVFHPGTSDVVVGVDRSAATQPALEFGFAVAQSDGRRLRAIHATPGGVSGSDSQVLSDALGRLAREVPGRAGLRRPPPGKSRQRRKRRRNVLAGVNADTASEHYWDVGLIRSNLVASPSRRFP